jgi:hypothetical protein
MNIILEEDQSAAKSVNISFLFQKNYIMLMMKYLTNIKITLIIMHLDSLVYDHFINSGIGTL